MGFIDGIKDLFCKKKKTEVPTVVEKEINVQVESDINIQPEKELNITINPKITTKDVRDQLWHCRDFELSHLWQRSIFLTTLLVLCLTAYGIVVMKLVETVAGSSVKDNAFVLNNIAMTICLIGFVFSCLWVMMSKASKAWYEMYEKAIGAFESNSNYVDDLLLETGEKEKKDANYKKAIGGFRYTNLKNFSKQGASDDIKSGLFNCKGGAYSPSKINIAIGQISFGLWGIALISHLVLAINEFSFPEYLIRRWIPWALVVIFVLLLLVMIFIPHKLWVKSSILKNYEYKKEDKEKKMKDGV